MEWWKEAVIYQIYPRSFKDSNQDGIGDIEGIIQKLDYLAGNPDSLGIDAIWLSPIYPSPMFDFGYDISNYESIDPVFGNMKTFENLLSEAHKRGIRIIMDLVVNHTSFLHPWFLESRSSKDNPKRDWYIWKPPVNGKEPNNWLGAFGGKAWTFDEKTKEYYYHSFLSEQPDLNWRNPQVKEAIFSMVKFWLNKGVDGFRLDVVNLFFKDDQFRNNDSLWYKGPRPYDRQIHLYDRDRPEMHQLLRELRSLLDGYGDRMSVGEIMMDYPGNVQLPASYYGNGDELHLAFNFKFLYSSWKAKNFFNIVKDFELALGSENWPNYTLSNHDFPRHISRYKKKNFTQGRAKLSALMLLTLRGTPFLYYGEEIGMERERVPRKMIQDPVGIRYWPLHPGRDPERLPMCWTDEEYAGFSKTKPWLPLYSKWKSTNVKSLSSDSDSLLNFYKKTLKLRKDRIEFREGVQEVYLSEDEDIFYYSRIYSESQRSLVILNFATKERTFFIKEEWNTARILFSTDNNRKTDSEVRLSIVLAPCEGLILSF